MARGGSDAAWRSGGLTFLLVGFGYLLTLAPTVTIEDSGELAVAARYWGVPHPPGFPLWALAANVVQRALRPLSADLAFRTNLFSALCGALAAALLAAWVSNAGRSLLPADDSPRSSVRTLAAVLSGCLFGFSETLWSQSVITEVYSLSTLTVVLLLIAVYRWLQRPEHDLAGVCVLAGLLGLAIVGHQSNLLLVPAVQLAIVLKWTDLGRDLMWLNGAGCLGIVGYALLVPGAISSPVLVGGVVAIGSGSLIAAAVLTLRTGGAPFSTWRQLAAAAGCFVLGLSLYLYVIPASHGNPPSSWSYATTAEGLWSLVTRGQYVSARSISGAGELGMQLIQFATFHHWQFSMLGSLLGIVAIARLRGCSADYRKLLLVTFVVFVLCGPLQLVLLNPQLDAHSTYLARVVLLPAHAVFAFWIGLGVTWVAQQISRAIPRRRWATAALALVLFLPLAHAARRNWSRCEQRLHTFAWSYGHESLRETAPEAILLCGTDAGLFIPTYMVYGIGKPRSKAYLVNHTALADHHYLRVLRRQYGAQRSGTRRELYPEDPIWIAGPEEYNASLRRFVAQDASGGSGSRELSIRGAGGVARFSSVLTRQLWERNRDRRPFYVVGSYPDDWMVPFLVPHGSILRLLDQAVDTLPEEIVAADTAYWDERVRLLEFNPAFSRAYFARRAWSKLRASIAEFYAKRGKYEQAAAAFEQARRLCPTLASSNVRLFRLYQAQGRTADARRLIREWRALDPRNPLIDRLLPQSQAAEPSS